MTFVMVIPQGRAEQGEAVALLWARGNWLRGVKAWGRPAWAAVSSGCVLFYLG